MGNARECEGVLTVGLYAEYGSGFKVQVFRGLKISKMQTN
jgi:hypothetical protein